MYIIFIHLESSSKLNISIYGIKSIDVSRIIRIVFGGALAIGCYIAIFFITIGIMKNYYSYVNIFWCV